LNEDNPTKEEKKEDNLVGGNDQKQAIVSERMQIVAAEGGFG
jgi:hypothetical protein